MSVLLQIIFCFHWTGKDVFHDKMNFNQKCSNECIGWIWCRKSPKMQQRTNDLILNPFYFKNRPINLYLISMRSLVLFAFDMFCLPIAIWGNCVFIKHKDRFIYTRLQSLSWGYDPELNQGHKFACRQTKNHGYPQRVNKWNFLLMDI